MNLPALHLKPTLVALIWVTLLTACTQLTSSSLTGASPLPGIKQIALLPVVFDERTPDRHAERRMGMETRWQARRILEYKGYQVHLIDDPSLHQVIISRQINPETLAAMVPESIDGVMLIRIDHFLYDNVHRGNETVQGFNSEASGTLDIYATAQLVLPRENRIVWQGKGFVSNNRDSSPPGLIEIDAARSLIDILFASLPTAATHPP